MTEHEIKEGVGPKQKHTCPKCHAVVWSSKKPEYCVCGGKYQTMPEILKTIFNYIDDLGEVEFRDIFGGTK